MSNYYDKWGRIHHKPVTAINPVPSNNGWIYTAYLQKLGYQVDLMSLAECFRNCKRNDDVTGRFFLIRSPNKHTPPISRDEILGMVSLGFLKDRHLNGWNFCPYELPKFNLIKCVKQLLELRGKHRNYVWQNNMDQVYRFAFSVPLTDRHFILKKWGRFNLFYWAIAKLDSLIGTPKNGIAWLKYGGKERKEIMKREFPKDHPIKRF